MMIVIAAMASKAGAMMRTRVFMPANIAGDKKSRWLGGFGWSEKRSGWAFNGASYRPEVLTESGVVLLAEINSSMEHFAI